MIYDLDEADDALTFMPLAARRALDRAGRKLSLDAWRTLSLDAKRAVVAVGAADDVDPLALDAVLKDARPEAETVAPTDDPPKSPPPEIQRALGAERPLDDATWRKLSPLDRYVFVKLFSRGRIDKLPRAYDEIVLRPTHLDARGAARMVDVGEKAITHRRAVASSIVVTTAAVARQIADGTTPKGDAIATARIAGILAAKRTPELIPLCHTIALSRVDVEITASKDGTLAIRATAEARDRTGVEMEAMVAASVAALTIYDMIKAMDRWATIRETRLEEKSGGRSGDVVRSGT